jgi:hypothetical protein
MPCRHPGGIAVGFRVPMRQSETPGRPSRRRCTRCTSSHVPGQQHRGYLTAGPLPDSRSAADPPASAATQDTSSGAAAVVSRPDMLHTADIRSRSQAISAADAATLRPAAAGLPRGASEGGTGDAEQRLIPRARHHHGHGMPCPYPGGNAVDFRVLMRQSEALDRPAAAGPPRRADAGAAGHRENGKPREYDIIAGTACRAATRVE